MHDEITEIKAMEIQHEQKTTAQLEAFNRSVEDLNLAMSTHKLTVEGFQAQLDSNRKLTGTAKDTL